MRVNPKEIRQYRFGTIQQKKQPEQASCFQIAYLFNRPVKSNVAK